jgi:hypothetical protein
MQKDAKSGENETGRNSSKLENPVISSIPLCPPFLVALRQLAV